MTPPPRFPSRCPALALGLLLAGLLGASAASQVPGTGIGEPLPGHGDGAHTARASPGTTPPAHATPSTGGTTASGSTVLTAAQAASAASAAHSTRPRHHGKPADDGAASH